MPTQVDALVALIVRALPGANSLDEAFNRVVEENSTLFPDFEERFSEELALARKRVEAQYGEIEILRSNSIVRKRESWYFGPGPGSKHWPALREFLENSKGWDRESIDGIDRESNTVVSLLEDPAQRDFAGRGLVVGHVQSGKTANMTGVIAKAVDAGYNTVILLAGLTNKLRAQTQLRIISDLVDRHPNAWQVHTPNGDDGDFRAPPHGGFLTHVDKAHLAVVKKNVSPLNQLLRAIERTQPIALRRLRVLIIDDECDQASVNSAKRELDMTAINASIREILATFPAVTYVGYTATPFANVLINPYKPGGEELDDLYPKDFITSLTPGKGYFGTERLFGSIPDDPENPDPGEEGLDMIRQVPEEEVGQLQPPSLKTKDTFTPTMVASLQDATLYFLATCAARRDRGASDSHMTMLVHTSAWVSNHDRVAAVIRGWLDIHSENITTSESAIQRRLLDLWAGEQERLTPQEFGHDPIPPDRLLSRLPEVMEALEVCVENGSSEDRIDYSGPPRTYIVVGGSILARGLTLEGLAVSYFLRSSNQYDTLLQMGRWFGYRLGYEDLPRLWMPDELKVRFRSLGRVESEIRDDIAQYASQDLTPLDVAVRIRSIPGMAITGATKMRHATSAAISFWGTHRQTFRFHHHDADELNANWKAAAELLDLVEGSGLAPEEDGPRVWRGVPRSLIRHFLKRYSFHEAHQDLASEALIDFLDSGDPRLNKWNVALAEPSGGRFSEKPLGAAGPVRMVNRARLTDKGNSADIKALMSKRDVLADCRQIAVDGQGWDELKEARRQELGDVPLLLLYAIDRDSRPKQAGPGVRTSLDAVEDILGLGIVFPGSISEGAKFVSVRIDPLSAEELEALDAAESEQAEAAGVE